MYGDHGGGTHGQEEDGEDRSEGTEGDQGPARGTQKGEWVLLTNDSLQRYRKGAHLSRAKLAEIMAVSSTTIQNWESGKAVPTKKSQARLADLIKGGATEARSNGTDALPSRASSNGGASSGVELNVTGEILKAFLATAQGGRTTQEQLVQLTRSLRAALA